MARQPRHLRRPGHARRVRSAWGTAAACDLLVIVVDAYRQVHQPDPRVLRTVGELSREPLAGWQAPPAVLVLNKADRLPLADARSRLALLAARLRSVHPFEEVFVVSAATGAGVPALRRRLLDRWDLQLPFAGAGPGEWILDEEEPTDLTTNELAQEVVREKLFQRLRAELPYTLRLQHTESKTLRDGSLRLAYQILVPTTGARQIVVGSKGAVVGQVGVEARRELEALLRKRVHLMLSVTVQKSSAR